MPNYLVKRLQRVQNCAAGYVLGSYANAVNVVNLKCLPILEGIEYNISTPSMKPTLMRRGGLCNLEVSTQCINK